jgi:hypothetical protein
LTASGRWRHESLPAAEQNEHSAVALVVNELGGAIARDDGVADGMRDFDVVFHDGHTEPLESRGAWKWITGGCG